MSESKKGPCVQLCEALIGTDIKIVCTLPHGRNGLELEGLLIYMDDDDIVLAKRDTFIIDDSIPEYKVHILGRDTISSINMVIPQILLEKFLDFHPDGKKKEETEPAFVKDMKEEEKEKTKVEGSGPLPAK